MREIRSSGSVGASGVTPALPGQCCGALDDAKIAPALESWATFPSGPDNQSRRFQLPEKGVEVVAGVCGADLKGVNNIRLDVVA